MITEVKHNECACIIINYGNRMRLPATLSKKLGLKSKDLISITKAKHGIEIRKFNPLTHYRKRFGFIRQLSGSGFYSFQLPREIFVLPEVLKNETTIRHIWCELSDNDVIHVHLDTQQLVKRFQAQNMYRYM